MAAVAAVFSWCWGVEAPVASGLGLVWDLGLGLAVSEESMVSRAEERSYI